MKTFSVLLKLTPKLLIKCCLSKQQTALKSSVFHGHLKNLLSRSVYMIHNMTVMYS